MDMKAGSLHMARSSQTFQNIEGLAFIATLVLKWIEASILGFLRRDFGERYYSWFTIFAGYTVVANLAFAGNALWASATGEGFSWSMVAVWAAFTATSLYHRWVMRRKLRAGHQWHTRYCGMSLIPGRLSEEVKLGWLEPALVLAVGAAAWPFSHLVGLWLVMSAVALWLHSQIRFHYQRQALLNAIDARLEGQFFGEALKGRPATQTAGVAIAESVRRRVANDPGLAAAFERLQPETASLVTAIEARP